MQNDFYTKFDCKSAPFITAGFVTDWYQSHKVGADAVMKAMRESAEEAGGRFLDVSDLKSNNQVLDNNDVIHFSRESQHIMGQRFFEAYLDVVKESR